MEQKTQTVFLDKLKESYELVQGCRLPAGGGKVMPDAMPYLHRESMIVEHNRWLAQPDQILKLPRTHFNSEQQSIARGKLTFVSVLTWLSLRADIADSRADSLPAMSRF